MNNFISIGSCLSYLIGNRYKKIAQANFLSSTRHNRIDKIVDVYLETNKPELSYSYLSKFKFEKDSRLDLEQQINNQFSDKSLGKTSLYSDTAIGLTDIIKNPSNINLIIYDTFGDLLFKLLWSKKDRAPFFFNIKYSENWHDYFEIEKERISIEQIIFYYIKFVKFFLQKNRNIKIIFINFPLFHHHSFLVRDRVKELNYAFIKNIFLQNNSFFIPALKLPKEHINEKDINHFKNFNGRSVYKYYAKIIKFIMDDYFDNQTWQKLSQIEEKTLLDKLDEIIIKSTTYQGKKMQIEKTNVQINSQKLAKEYLKQLNELASHDKHDEVIAKSKQLLELDFNNSDIYNDIEKILLKNNKNNQLIEIYKQAIQCRPTNSWLYKRLGDSYYKEDKLDNAIDCYERAIEINKNFFWSYKKLGDSYQVKGRQYFKKAYDSYQKAIEIKSNFEDNLTKKLEKISQVIDQSHSSNHLPKDRNNYWNKRKDGLLYQMIKSLASGYVPNGSSVLEVGCHTSSFIFELDWFKEKVVTDLPFLSEHWQGIEGVKFIPGDFYKLKFDRTFDLVLCTQVVEHLQEPKLFIQKLLSLGKTVIVSTTYEVPEGLCKYHVQDPISLEKFQEWFDREFTATVIIEKPNQKIWKNIIGVVKQE